jgi:hypothetical protein
MVCWLGPVRSLSGRFVEGKDMYLLDFKFSPCSESCIFSFGYFAGVRLSFADVSKPSVRSIFKGLIKPKRKYTRYVSCLCLRHPAHSLITSLTTLFWLPTPLSFDDENLLAFVHCDRCYTYRCTANCIMPPTARGIARCFWVPGRLTQKLWILRTSQLLIEFYLAE